MLLEVDDTREEETEFIVLYKDAVAEFKFPNTWETDAEF